jgi:hypothetical protein
LCKLVMTKLFIIMPIVFICLNVNGQQVRTKGLLVETQIMEYMEYSTDATKTVKSAINLSYAFRGGFTLQDSVKSWSLYYDFRNLRFADPRWNKADQGSIHSTWGPNYLHSIGIEYTRNFKSNHLKNKHFFAGLGLMLTYCSYNKDEPNAIPVDSTAFDRFVYYYDSEFTEEKFTVDFYSRFMSDFGLTTNFRLGRSRMLGSRIKQSYGATYSLGLNTLYQVDYWFRDNVNNVSGSGVLLCRGTNLGIFYQLHFML